jgi:hypothetical protein
LFIGLLENGYSVIKDDLEKGIDNYVAAQGWSEEKYNSKKAIELNNGKTCLIFL